MTATRVKAAIGQPTHEGGGEARIREKWGEAIVPGFQAVPDTLLKNQDRLGLNPTELVVLLNVLMHWWYAGKKPFPRPTTIAKRMGSTVRTVQRAINQVVALGLLIPEQGPDQEDFLNPEPLVQKLGELARSDPEYASRRNRRDTA